MPPTVSVSNLSWSLPDGRQLFTDLNLSFGQERTGIVGRNGSGKTTLLRMIAGDLLPISGKVQLSGSIAIMRQDLAGNPNETIADLLSVRPALDVLDRVQAGHADAEDLAVADWTLPSRIEAALTWCGVLVGPQTPLVTLSGGQLTRAALAGLILTKPDFLLLDEPTNNLDRAGRKAVIEVIRSWSGGAIIVSHDREVLEEVDAIIEINSLGVTRYGGNYSAYRGQKDSELDAAQRRLAHAEKARRGAARRAQLANERKARKDSAGHKARAKGDQPKILMDAAKGKAETSGGALARLREARRESADEALFAAREQVEVIQPLRMDIPMTGLSAGKTVLRLNNVTGGYDRETPVICDLSLSITGPERVVIAGPNGSGKSTVLKIITGQILPQRGTVELMVSFAMLDQHVGFLDPARSLHDNFQLANPSADSQVAYAALARFGFRDNETCRKAGDLSGGERLRAGLSCVLGVSPPPMLLILDEPTNHLDLEGIAALEAAIEDYDGAVLAVTHDRAFLRSFAPDWTLSLDS